MESDLTHFCLKKIKDLFDYISVSIHRNVQIPEVEDTVEFMNTYVSNIDIMETQVIKPFDRGNHYTRMRRMVGRTLNAEEKELALRTNIRVFQKLPKSVQDELCFIPDCDLSIVDVFKSNSTYDLFKHIQDLYAYAKYYLKLTKAVKEQENNPQEIPEELFGTVKYPALSDDKQEKVYDEVRDTINQYESKGLNTALGEVIKELKAPGTVNQEEGMNIIDSGKLMAMASNVAGTLTNALNDGETTVSELVNDTDAFITDLMDSPMFANHPDNKQIKQLFGSLMERVKFMNEADTENNSMLTQDIDKILGLNEEMD